MKISLSKKILAGFISSALVLLVVAIISFRNSEKFIDTNQWVNHTYEVLNELEQILINSVDGETGARGYVITGSDTFLEPYNTATSQLQIHITAVRELTKDNPAQQQNIDRIEKQATLHFQHLARCVDLRKSGDFEKARTLVSSGEGKRILDQLRTMTTGARGIEQTLLAERRQASETDARDFNRIFMVLLLIIVIVLIVVYVIISSNLAALRKAEKETADKNWSLTGSSQLTRGTQGNKLVAEVAQAIISHLAPYLNAPLGAFYITHDDGAHLHLAGAYSIGTRKKAQLDVAFGEGFAGQAARESRTLLVTEIPKTYFNLETSFGTAAPKSIIAVPVLFEGGVVAVIELGSLDGFSDLQKQYLELISDSVAIAITSAQSRQKTTELLEETQRQAEELEVQQEELRQSNDELHAKTELLERSELELKTQQEELRQANEELEEKANMLEDQKMKLEDANSDIEAKARAIEVTSKYKSEFLANMSHELRTPLNSVLLLAQLLSENKNKTLSAKDIEFAKNIHSSGNDLLNLINEILDLSKVEAGKMELDIEQVALGDIVGHMLSMFSETAKNKSLDFQIDYRKGLLPPAMITDRLRVEQILRNMISNAFKFTEKGGKIVLKIFAPEADTVFRNKNLETVSDRIGFSVSDTGIGIAEGKQAIIFEAFQQADGSTKRKYGGTGLGLSISRELSQVLGGEIQLASEEGKGSTFTLFLPITFDASLTTPVSRPVEVKERKTPEVEVVREARPFSAPENPADDDREKIREGDRVILIIEDESQFAKILLQFIRDRNYKGIIASQGNSGLSFARHYKPDAIFLDMKLPMMNGADVLRQLKNDPALRHIPVQIISAFDHRREGLELGAFDFLHKPVSTTDLHKAFDKIESFTSKKLKKLLIVEDNEQQNNAIRELIGNGDVHCFSAYLGSEAYKLLNKESFDCIIVDLGLPDMSGFDLLEKIKSNIDLNRIPIIVYTGKDLKKEDNARLNKLATTVVLKTVDSKERLLDETSLFLHRVESKLPKEKQSIIRQLRRADEILDNKTILIVDDDVRNIYSLTNALEEAGMKCLTAENGKLGVDMLRNNPSVDLVLMDVMMPEMDGYEATQEIRKEERYGKLPIIALTAKAMKGDKEKCLSVGMSDYVSKPVNLDQLLSLMRVWIYR